MAQISQTSYPTRITLLTLFSYACGLAFFSVQSPFNYGISFGLLILVCGIFLFLSMKLQNLFYQGPIMLLKFVTTTYIFGLVHGYTYQVTRDFLSHQSKDINKILPLFQIYLSFLCIYYYFEFQLNNNFHHAELCWKSFLIYHSKPYLIANAFSLTEHFLIKYVFHFQYKVAIISNQSQNSHILIYPALLFMIFGQGLRIAAFFTAKSNFTHLVRYRKHREHQLVTNGVYAFFRHPSYTGYFYFSVASQIFLGNWVSAIGFFIVLIKFFTQRIEDEELMLASFFEKYLYYKKKTYILIPFVKDPSSQDIMKQLIKHRRYTSSGLDTYQK